MHRHDPSSSNHDNRLHIPPQETDNQVHKSGNKRLVLTTPVSLRLENQKNNGEDPQVENSNSEKVVAPNSKETREQLYDNAVDTNKSFAALEIEDSQQIVEDTQNQKSTQEHLDQLSRMEGVLRVGQTWVFLSFYQITRRQMEIPLKRTNNKSKKFKIQMKIRRMIYSWLLFQKLNQVLLRLKEKLVGQGRSLFKSRIFPNDCHHLEYTGSRAA